MRVIVRLWWEVKAEDIAAKGLPYKKDAPVEVTGEDLLRTISTEPAACTMTNCAHFSSHTAFIPKMVLWDNPTGTWPATGIK